MKFHFEQRILSFWTKFAQRGYLRLKREREHHHLILYIRIRLGIKFKLKLTILIFLTKFARKEYFRSNTKKVNTTTEFCIFELV